MPKPDAIPAPLSMRPSARPSRPTTRAKAPARWLVPASAAGILLVGATTLALLGRGRSSEAALTAPSAAPQPLPAPSAKAEASPFTDTARVDPSDLYPKAKQRALAWNPDARLVSITASPVVGDKVDLTREGAEVVYVFGTDAAARSRPFGRLAVTARRGGIEQAPADLPKPAPAHARATPAGGQVVEPNCVFDAAAKAAHASGIPAAQVMRLRYEADAALGRGVWTARVPGRSDLERVIDGQTCAVVIRR